MSEQIRDSISWVRPEYVILLRLSLNDDLIRLRESYAPRGYSEAYSKQDGSVNQPLSTTSYLSTNPRQ